MRFDLDPLLNSEPVIVWHTVLALVALILGAAIWRLKKGTRLHKYAGRTFIILMLGVASSAYFIRGLNGDKMSFIHIFIPITFLGAYQAITRIRAKNVKGHKKAIQGMYFGALIIPGIFAMMPGRILWNVFFGT
jgi:uncharacterized membrane protein